LNELKALEAQLEGRPFSSFHGAGSAVLIGLQKTAGCLYPTGKLCQMGLYPLSGELKDGAQSVGINQHGISASSGERLWSSLRYAQEFHLVREDLLKAVQKYENYHPPVLETADAFLQMADSYMRRYYQGLLPEQRQKYLDRENGNKWLDFAQSAKVSSIAYKVAQGKQLGVVQQERLAHLKSLTLTHKDAWKKFKQTNAFKLHMPESRGGQWPDAYYARIADAYEAGLDFLLEVIETPLTPLEEHLHALIHKPFDILFEINVPCMQHAEASEFNYYGPLGLGREVGKVYVPSAHVDWVSDWVKKHVPGRKKPEVLALETLLEHQKRAIGEPPA
jgi:hypothetical protein